MRQLLSILYSLLREHPWEVLFHERVKIGIAFSCLKVLSLQESKGYDYLQ